MTAEPPDWLLRTRDLHRRTGASHRHIALHSGLSLTSVGNILSGRCTPTPASLRKLLGALTDNTAVVNGILEAFLAENPDTIIDRDLHPYLEPGPGHIAALTQAVNRLAAAVEYYTETAQPDHH